MKADLYTPEGVPVVRGTNIVKSRSPQGDFVYVSTETAESMPGCVLAPGDLVFPHRGAIGEVGLIEGDADTRMMLSTSLMKLTPDKTRIDSRYVYYYFSSELGRRELLMRASTVGTPGIGQPLTSLRSIPIPVPPIEEQRGIAETLGALDDKIESNQRSQVTGEKLIRSLVTAALERSTGEVGVLRDYCNLIKEPARIGALTADLHYIAFEHMPRGSIFLDDWGNAEGLGSDKSYFQVGDILFGKLRPYFKKVGIAPVDGVCSTDILVLRPIRKADTALVAVVASSDPLIDSLSAAATGTRMPRASWKDLASWPVPEMTTLERDELADQVAPLVERLTAMTHETKQLQLLRDTLLPELLSGRIRVPEAREAVREVVA